MAAPRITGEDTPKARTMSRNAPRSGLSAAAWAILRLGATVEGAQEGGRHGIAIAADFRIVQLHTSGSVVLLRGLDAPIHAARAIVFLAAHGKASTERP